MQDLYDVLLFSSDLGCNKIIYSNGETLQHPCYIPGTQSQTSSSTFGVFSNTAYENSIAGIMYKRSVQYWDPNFFEKLVLSEGISVCIVIASETICSCQDDQSIWFT